MSQQTTTSTDLGQLQGNVLAPFAKDHQAFIALRLPDKVERGRAWVTELSDLVATNDEVSRFNSLFKDMNSRRHGEHGVLKATWVQLLLSGRGLVALGVPEAEVQNVSEPLHVGMAARADILQDRQESDPSGWVHPFGESDVHAMLVIASDDRADLHHQMSHQLAIAHRHRVQPIWQHEGATLPGALRGHEHFGFKDGVSQPAVEGPDPVDLNEFVLGLSAGQPDPWGATPELPAWATGSSLVVFRMLAQDVAAFRGFVQTQAGTVGLQPDALGAKLVGRWKSGAPLALSPNNDDPVLAADSAKNNAFDYSDDPDGTNTPRFAHIRKVAPRAENPGPAPGDAAKRRLLRRGIPFGAPLPDSFTDAQAKRPRGLFFLGVQANLEQQFEFIQQNWCNNPDFPVGPHPQPQVSTYQPSGSEPADGPDPIIGQHHGTGVDNLGLSQGEHQLALQQFVRTLGGEYFISLTVPALSQLGG
jgi:Dyp-type peroxidase family